MIKIGIFLDALIYIHIYMTHKQNGLLNSDGKLRLTKIHKIMKLSWPKSLSFWFGFSWFRYMLELSYIEQVLKINNVK